LLGKREALERTVTTLLSGGHLLIEDAPGVGKTVLARALAASLGVTFGRIQFTPDLLPADITGTSIYRDGNFDFRPGPIFANVVLADEINRATPRTQAALLEAMQEGQVTVDGVTHVLPRPFFVIATQNPIELAGTYPLPEAQLDRFTQCISIGYPDAKIEAEILASRRVADPLAEIEVVVSADELLDWQALVRAIPVHPAIRDYIVALVGATRQHPELELGASPRASLALMRCAQARALLRSATPLVEPDDVKTLAATVLSHRLVLSARSQLADARSDRIIAAILRQVAVPIEL
jgi:MoxR-like ATPase